MYARPKQSFALDDLDARLATRGNLITLDSLTLPPGHLYGKWRRGTIDYAQARWRIERLARGL